jgi:pre-60S factor REI1
VAETEEALRKHYRDEWHVFNAKRRAQQQPPLARPQFKELTKKNKRENRGDRTTRYQRDADAPVRGARSTKHVRDARDEESSHRSTQANGEEEQKKIDEERASMEDHESLVQTHEETLQETDSCTSVFDARRFDTCEQNVAYMHKQYGLFIPDREYLIDLDGLIDYLNAKVKLGHVCLYCQKYFSSASACQRHMISKSHCKLLYDERVDGVEYEDFYDFSPSYRQLDNQAAQVGSSIEVEGTEDMSVDAYHLHPVAPKVSSIGELVLLDGRTVGHRDLRRYYRQRARLEDDRPAVLAAKRAFIERIAPLALKLSPSEVSALTMRDALRLVTQRQRSLRRDQRVSEQARAREGLRVGMKKLAQSDPSSSARILQDYNVPR